MAVLLFMLSFGVQAQEGLYDFPTDRAELPYNVEEMVALIQNAYEAPEETNAYALMVEDFPGIPAMKVGEKLSKGQVKRLTKWVEENPSAIESLLIARKKNYDKYFNPAYKGKSKK